MGWIERTMNILGPGKEKPGKYAIDRLSSGQLKWEKGRLALNHSEATPEDFGYIGIDVKKSVSVTTEGFLINPEAYIFIA